MRKQPSSTTSKIELRRIRAQRNVDNEYSRRRQLLLQAAVKIFKKKGYAAANVMEIAKAVGIDRAALYYYTAGKEDLFQEIVREASLSATLMAEQTYASDMTAREKLKTFIVSLMALFEQHYPYLYVFVQEDMTQISGKTTKWASEMSSYNKRTERAVIAMVEQGIRDGSFRPDSGSAGVLASGIIGMCNWTHRWFQPKRMPARTIGNMYASMVLSGLDISGSGELNSRTKPGSASNTKSPAKKRRSNDRNKF